MFLKKMYNKLSRVLLSVLILNLMFWNLLLAPAQTQAATGTGRWSCDPETGTCFDDDNGLYTCPTACANACSNTTTPSASSGGCGSAPITGTIDVYITGSTEQSAAEAAAQEGINTLEDLANATGLIDEAKQSLIDLINQNKPIPENLKEFMISAITNDADISSDDKETLIDLINKGKPISEEFKGIVTDMIGNLTNTMELVKNKFLDLILSGLNIDWICQQLANAVTGLPWGLGAAISTAIAMACPPLLKDFLTEVGFYEEKLKTDESTQIIPVPTLEYYEWEVGIPGFIKPGQSTKFK
jgi:hypothetical protein